MQDLETDLSVFAQRESEVRSYCRNWPVVFQKAQGTYLYDEHGKSYLDFFAGAGALNYGHNNPVLKRPLLDYIESDNVVHGLDMATTAKRDFLETFHELVLHPRGLDHRVMFPGPTGTNAVEAALKLARKVTGRQTVAFCANGFYGMTLGSLAVTGNAAKRGSAGLPLSHGIPISYGSSAETAGADLEHFERLLANPSSGLDRPAAVIVETVQGEGGVHVASEEWLRGLQQLCRRYEMLLIVDDVQMGCGRTGGFFSFEQTGITPDLITVSKSISGYGLPMALTLIAPGLDIWNPGEHNGTFRGNNPAFVTATAALRNYWSNADTEKQTLLHGERVDTALSALAGTYPQLVKRGRGLIWGLEVDQPSLAQTICRRAFENGLVLETSGPHDEVIKLLPPVTIDAADLDRGLAILAKAVHETL